ncbi:MAG TPA: ATPase, partial [Janibacter terrae]|nr:ATPase [Janibacter terrae]
VTIAVGTLVLMTPFASQSREATDPLTALFTATSATCVTGLVTVDTATHWSTFGEIVVLALIQLGGLGVMSAATLLVMLIGRR